MFIIVFTCNLKLDLIREKQEKGWKGRGLHLSNLSPLYRRPAAVCKHTTSLHPPLWLDANLEAYDWDPISDSSSSLYIHPHSALSSQSLVQTQTPREGSWHVSWMHWNFVRDPSLIVSAGSCCPPFPRFLPAGPRAFYSVRISADATL